MECKKLIFGQHAVQRMFARGITTFNMKCVICRQGDTAPGKVTVTLHREESTIVVKDVPAAVCENCGEFYLSETVTEKLLSRADAAVKRGAELEILRYAA